MANSFQGEVSNVVRARPRGFAARIVWVIPVILMIPWTVSIGDEDVSLSVVNDTRYYLHVIMNDEPYLYVPSNGSAMYKSEGPTHVQVQVFYSPGQGVSGSATRSIRLSVEGSGTTCYEDSRGGCHCASEPVYGQSIVWHVRPDTLTTEGP